MKNHNPTNKALNKKLRILKSISSALQEVEDIKSGKRKEGRTLEQFLNENQI
jgi:hypothetical protein